MITQRLLRELHVAGERFLAPLTPFETHVALVEEGRKLSKAEWGSVFVLENGEFKKIYASIPSLIAVKPRKHGTVYKAFHTRKSILYSSKQVEDLRKNHFEFKHLPIKSTVLIPLSYGNEAMGVLCLHSTEENHFTREHVQLLELFCSMAFLCIRKTQLYDQARKALELRDLFISIAAHELKTPLTAASLYSDMLKNKLIEKALPELKLSQSLSDEITRLKRLINEFLQVELIKKGKLHYQWNSCSLQQIIKRAIGEFRHSYPFYTVQVQYNLLNGNDTVLGDFDKLLQVITNLLTNAAKYSPATAPITVEIREKAKEIMVTVIDKGRGIPKKDLPKIFNKFYKGENSLHEGMGLGLYLIKNIVDNHGGVLNINSIVNKGTSVSVVLPILK